MCTGTALLYKIPRIVVGENITFTSIGEKWFTDNNVKVHIAQNQTCIQMMKDFIRDKPELWNEDIHVIDS
jgi:creatinine deaminase